MSVKLYVLCGSACAVPAVACGQENTVKYVYQKTEYTKTYEHLESFSFPRGQVRVLVPVGASTPCFIPLPSPFNQTLKLGSTLLFQVDASLDFVNLWNDCCSTSLTWQHSRPKKITDPSQKLGLPAKLNEYLREQIYRYGMDVPMGSDVSDDDAAVNDSEDSDNSSTKSVAAVSDYDNNDSDAYYSTLDEDDNEDIEEEEEVEEEPEPEELLEDE